MAMINRGWNDPDSRFYEDNRPLGKNYRQALVAAAPPPVAAPPPPPAFTYKPPSLGGYDEYMAQQKTDFTPVDIGGGGGYMHDSYETPYRQYSYYDPNITHQNYMDKLYSESGVSPELGNMFESIYRYQGARDSLAKNIGFTGRTGVQGPDLSGGTNEGGYESFGPSTVISPEYAQALTGYKFQPSTQGKHPAVDVFKPNGEKVGQYRIGDATSGMMKFMSIAVPLLVTGGFGAALAPLVLGAGAGTAATMATAGAIGGGLNTAVHGGNLEDVLKSAAISGATAGASSFINTNLIKSLPGLSEGIQYASDTIGSALQGAPESLIDIVSGLPRNVVQGAARGLIKGDIAGGITDAVLGQIVEDVAPTLKLTGPQARSFATYLRDGNRENFALSVGSNLAKQAISAANAAAPGELRVSSTAPAWDEDFTSGGYSSDINYGLSEAGLTTPEQIPIIGDRLSIEDLLATNTGGGDVTTGPDGAQRVTIAGQKPVIEDDLLDLINMGGVPSRKDVTTGPDGAQTITIAARRPVIEDELNLPPYEYSIPELAPLAPPEITVEGEKPTAPPLGGGASTPSKGLDLNSLLYLLSGGGQEQVPSQVLAQMSQFDVGSMSQFAREQARKKAPNQQMQLDELIRALGYEG